MKFWPFKKRNDNQSDDLLSTAFENEFKAIRLRTRAAGTIKAYEITLRHFDRYLDRPARLSDLNDKTVAAFLDDRFRTRAARTVNRDLTNLRAISEWLWKRERVSQPLTEIEPYTAIDLVPEALTMEQIDLVWNSINNQPGLIGRVSAPIFLRALFMVFWDTAERFTAVTSIRVCDVNLKGATVFIRGETRKGGKSDRCYPIGDKCVSCISEMLGELGNVRATSKLFHIPYSRNKLWQILGEVMTRAGFPDDARHKTHLIRRTVATQMAAAGADATRQLDHSNTRITQKHYIDPRIARPQMAPDYLRPPGECTGSMNGHIDTNTGE